MTAARLCLNMIVRNEAQIIRRALDSVANHIAFWAICDTGSTDGTQRIITDYFAARGIPGALLEHSFDGFDQSRNRALDFARQSAGDFDYLLLMDADMQLQVEDPDFRDHLTAVAYMLTQKAGISYWNTRLLRREAQARYRGVTHEYLDLTGKSEHLAGIWFDDEADGSNRASKFERDIALLEGGLAAEPSNARYVYYLAQSYRDASQLERAAETYARRAAMGGWEEEVWSALLNEARCRLKLNDDAGFIETAGRALTARPQRAEPLYDLAVYYRGRASYEEAMTCCELASQIPYPSSDRLFIEDYVYRVGIWQEMSIAGFYCEAPARKQRARLACNALALDRQVPPTERAKARENLVFYARPLTEMLPSWRAWRLPWEPPCPGYVTNPSVAVVEGENWLVARVVNYETTNGIDFTVPEGEPYLTRNFLLRLDDDLRPIATREILLPSDLPPPPFARVLGFEDMRLFRWRDSFWASATTRQVSQGGWCEIVLSRLDTDASDAVRLCDWRVLSFAGPPRHEKNWMPRVAGDRLEFIYSSDPVRIVDATAAIVAETLPEAALDHLRGGSQVIAFNGGWLALTHEVSLVGDKRVYLHRFVWYDAANRLKRLTEAFVLNSRGIEFAAGLTWHQDGEHLVMSYGAGDAEAWLATVNAADVRGLLDNTGLGNVTTT